MYGTRMAIPQYTALYFDTNALRELRFEREITYILNACRAGEVIVYLSEWVIYEYARQYFERQIDFIISPIELIAKLSGSSKGQILQAYHIFFKSLFIEYGVHVINTSSDLETAAKEIITEESTYFLAANVRDQRDARIFAAAVQFLPVDRSLIVTGDKNLGVEFSRKGFDVRDDVTRFVGELSLKRTSERIVTPDLSRILSQGREGEFPDHFHTALRDVDPSYAELFLPGLTTEAETAISLEEALRRVDEFGRADKEIRVKILSYVHWFAPITKDDLVSMLQEQQFEEDHIMNNASGLVLVDSLRDTGAHYLPGKDGLCEAIGNGHIHELIELLGGGL